MSRAPTATAPTWSSSATSPNVVSGEVDGNGGYNLYLLNRNTNTTTLVNHLPGSLTATGNVGVSGPSGGGEVSPAVISANGNFIAFESEADNLVGTAPANNPGTNNVYLYNRLTAAITLASHAVGSSTTSGDSDSFAPQINADGSFVTFISLASNLISGFSLAPSGFRVENLYLFSSASAANTLVSHDGENTRASATEDVEDDTISDNGNNIAYTTQASNLLPAGTEFESDIYLYSRLTNSSLLISHEPGLDGSEGNGPSFQAEISADGSSVAFSSLATNLVSPALPATGFSNVFLYDIATDTIALVSGQDGSASIGGNGSSVYPAINARGRCSHVVFRSSATDLVVGQNGPTGNNIFLYNGSQSPSTLTLISAAAGTTTTTANGRSSSNPVIDGDGSLSGFSQHRATNLVAGQAGGGVQKRFWERHGQ